MPFLEPHNLKYEPLSQSVRDLLLASAPECAAILSNPALEPIQAPARVPKASTEDAFIAITLATNRTIRLWQSFYRRFPPCPQATENNAEEQESPTDPVAGEVTTLLLVGDGVSGHPHVVHGGVLSAILDEVMGSVGMIHHLPDMAGFTAFLNVKFRRPAPAPGLLVCRAWMERRSGGRKLWARGVIEDANGKVYTEGECLFLEVPKEKL